MRACINVRADALPFDSKACNCFRSSGSNLTRYTFMKPHFTGKSNLPPGDPSLTRY